MSYNIRVAIQEGVDSIADVINEVRPNVVALQEVGRHWVMGPKGDTTAALAALCGFPHFCFVPSIEWFGPAQYGHALLSHWPIHQARMHRLPTDVDEPRSALSAWIDGPRGFHVVSTHLSHVDDRALQGPKLLELARSLDGPLLLLGDLNEAEVDVPWMRALRSELSDAFPDDAPPTFPALSPERRIDYLLVRGGVWTKKRVVENHDSASDHRAVVGELEWTV